MISSAREISKYERIWFLGRGIINDRNLWLLGWIWAPNLCFWADLSLNVPCYPGQGKKPTSAMAEVALTSLVPLLMSFSGDCFFHCSRSPVNFLQALKLCLYSFHFYPSVVYTKDVSLIQLLSSLFSKKQKNPIIHCTKTILLFWRIFQSHQMNVFLICNKTNKIFYK